MLFWAPAAPRHRVPTGVSSARPFGTGRAAPPARWRKSRQRSKRRASIHAGTLLADPLPNGLVATLPPLFVPAHFRPQNTVGGENGRFAVSGCGFAALSLAPSRPPSGRRGELKERRVRVLFSRSFPLVTQNQRLALFRPASIRRVHQTRPRQMKSGIPTGNRIYGFLYFSINRNKESRK
jgi:hypothetical protein